MTITVNFRVVGIYCYFPNMELDLDPDAKIKDVHDAIVEMDPKPHNGIFEIMYENDANSEDLTGFKYKYTNESILPPDATDYRAEGDDDNIRTLKETEGLDDHDVISSSPEVRVWQYYVSAIMEKEGNNRIIIARDTEQRDPRPPHSVAKLKDGLPLEVLKHYGFEVSAYNITWRLLTININDGAAQKRYSRRERTSGRIV